MNEIPARWAMATVAVAAAWCLLAEPSQAEEDPLNAVLQALEAAPGWALMPANEIEQKGAKLMEAMRECAQLPESDLRRLVQRFVAAHADSPISGDEVSAWSKIYVLNRFYFAVPSTEARSEVKIFGGWSGVPQEPDRLGILWPLEEEPDKTLRLAGTLQGYFGPNYRALEEFDFFSKKYGRRPGVGKALPP